MHLSNTDEEDILADLDSDDANSQQSNEESDDLDLSSDFDATPTKLVPFTLAIIVIYNYNYVTKERVQGAVVTIQEGKVHELKARHRNPSNLSNPELKKLMVADFGLLYRRCKNSAGS